ncbi:RNA-directed DNA polymerase, partial [Salmonella enterica]|nr:RNA-directed DNA polymerase [Salmonella enterica]
MDIIKKIADETLMPVSKVSAFIFTAPYRYKVYPIPKRNGGFREIAQPSRALKFMQRIVIAELEKVLKVHENAYAYVKGRSIKDNVEKHQRNSYILKVDFCDFFNSISPCDLELCLKNNGLDSLLSSKELLNKLFFYKKSKRSALSMSIGAPSSPFLSNAIMYNFDSVISDMCSNKNITYTRYADDLTFSTNEKGILYEFIHEIDKVLEGIDSPKLKLNDKKTIFASKKCNRHITGIVINNEGELSIGRDKKRYLSSLVHKFSLNALNEEEIEHLKGYLAYVNKIEPSFISGMKRKYGVEVVNSIIK